MDGYYALHCIDTSASRTCCMTFIRLQSPKCRHRKSFVFRLCIFHCFGMSGLLKKYYASGIVTTFLFPDLVMGKKSEHRTPPNVTYHIQPLNDPISFRVFSLCLDPSPSTAKKRKMWIFCTAKTLESRLLPCRFVALFCCLVLDSFHCSSDSLVPI